MLVKYLLPAVAAVGSVAAQSGTCTVSTTTINSAAEATGLASCKKIAGTVVIGANAGPSIDLSGPEEITGDLKVEHNGVITGFTGADLQKVGGAFFMNNVTRLASVSFPKLNQVKDIEWQSLTNLGSASLGSISEVNKLIVADTFLDSMEAVDVETAFEVNINNNRRLSQYTPRIEEIGWILSLQGNGPRLNVEFPRLHWAMNLSISNVTEFSAPLLQVVNGSARFISNNLTSVTFPNLTRTLDGDISFIDNNPFFTSLNLTKLTSIAGTLIVRNNTHIDKLDGFPSLAEIGGSIDLRGNFTEIEFPKLQVVKGTFNATSTKDIRESCDELQKLAPGSQGGNGNIQGRFECVPLNENANDASGSLGGGGGGGNGGGNGDSGAAGTVLNTALFGLVAVAAIASVL